METQGERSIKDIAEQGLPAREADPTNKHKASPTRRQYHVNQIPHNHGKHLHDNRESEEGRWNCSGLHGRLNGGNITDAGRNSPMEDQDNHSYFQGNHTSLADNHSYQENNHNYVKDNYTCPSNNHNYNQNNHSYNLINHSYQSSNHNSSQNNHNYLPNNHGQDSQNISKSSPTQHSKTDSCHTTNHTHTPRHSYHLTNHTHTHPARHCHHPAYHRPRYLLPLLLLSVVVPADGRLLDFAIPQMVQYGACIQPQTASDLDLPSFGGVWYPVMEVPNSYVEAKECIRSDYQWNGASFDVHSEGLDEYGDLSLQETSITQVMPADPTRPRPFLQIRSPNVPPVPYHILSTDYQTIACVYSCFEFLGMKVEFYSIISRTPRPSNVTLQACFEELNAQGLDLSKMAAVTQGEECWYSEVYPASSPDSISGPASSGSATSGLTSSGPANLGPDGIPLSYPRPNPEMSPLHPTEIPAPPADMSPDLPDIPPHPSLPPLQTLPSLTNPSLNTLHPPHNIPPSGTPPQTLPPLIIPPPHPPAATPPPLHIPPPDTNDTSASNLSPDPTDLRDIYLPDSSSVDSKPYLPVDDPLKAIDDQQRALDILVEDPEDLSQCDPPSSSSSSVSSPLSSLLFLLLFLLPLLSFRVER